jgi:GMP synthase (glutamine-hydrolysing)
MSTEATPAALCIIKTGDTLPVLRERHGDFEDWIARGLAGQGLPVRTIDPRQGANWPAPAQIAGVVVTGSPAMVTDRADWSERTAAWLAQLVEEEVPVLGICYGHQLLAHALGGTVGRHPQGIEIGTVTVECADAARGDALLGALLTHALRGPGGA